MNRRNFFLRFAVSFSALPFAIKATQQTVPVVGPTKPGRYQARADYLVANNYSQAYIYAANSDEIDRLIHRFVVAQHKKQLHAPNRETLI